MFKSPAEIAQGLKRLDDNIGRNIDTFEKQPVADRALGKLHRTYLASMGHLQQNPKAIYFKTGTGGSLNMEAAISSFSVTTALVN